MPTPMAAGAAATGRGKPLLGSPPSTDKRTRHFILLIF